MIARSVAVLLLALVACTTETASTSSTETSTIQASTTTLPPSTTTTASTTTTTTTTTIPPTTTTTFDPLGFLRETTSEERQEYGLSGALILSATAFSLDELGSDQFVEMLVSGAQLACFELHEGGSLPEAMLESLSQSPIRFTPVDEWTTEEITAGFTTAIHVLTQGVEIYCPDLVPTELQGDQDSVAEALSNAWTQVLEG